MSDATQHLFTRRTLLAALILILVSLAFLFVESRPWWCKYGLGFWSPAWTHCTSQHFLDPYALSHVLHGIIFYWLLRPFAAKLDLHSRLIAALVLEIGWEV